MRALANMSLAILRVVAAPSNCALDIASSIIKESTRYRVLSRYWGEDATAPPKLEVNDSTP